MTYTTSTAYSHTKAEMRKALLSKGWHTWYNENYWVHPKLVYNPEIQDYTNYGMTLENAFLWDLDKKAKPRLTLMFVETAIGILKNISKLMGKK